MIVFWTLLSCLIFCRTITAEKIDDTALTAGQILELECLQRNEDGEVSSPDFDVIDLKTIEDTKKQRLFSPFLICNETGYPPAFKYRHSTAQHRIPCTVTIDDPTFHLFQEYLHQDMPLICRLQGRRSEAGYWAQIPISLIGKVELSHFDIDPKINFILHYDKFHRWVTGGVGYSVGPVVTPKLDEKELGWQRVKIGDQITLEFSLRWISTEEIPNQHTHSGSNAFLIMAYPFLAGVGFMVLCRVLYSVIWSRQKIASVRQQTRFESPTLSMARGRGKTKRDMV